ncbi:MAG: DUF3078 domain-containing protein [Alphaproteobacteria bacterium]|nr:DUF3078 domain-containing protein [Alphaproteobacteria bacterium]
MSFTKFLLAGALLFAVPAFAAETADKAADGAKTSAAAKGGTLKANLRRLGLEMSSTEVKNAKSYKDSPVSQFNADSQTVIKGIFDGALEYDRSNLNWTNSLFMEYGKTKLKPADGKNTTSENADQILLTSEYTHKLWSSHGLDFGPFVSAGYQTEFTDNQDAPRTKILRGKAGVKLFNGSILKDLYVAGVYEYDMTYSDHVSKSAGEVGWRLEYTLREGVAFSTDGYFRDYFSYSSYIPEDLKYDLKATARMDVNLTNNLTFGPYVSYRQGKSRVAKDTASNTMIGVSLTYKDLYNIF